MKSIEIEYFASLKDAVQKDRETLQSNAETVEGVLQELQEKYHLSLNAKHLKVALNDEFIDFSSKISDGDRLVFIPPVAGG